MSAGKWIGGILGFMSGGALGALAGVALGALFDYGLKAVNKDEGGHDSGFSDRAGEWEEARRRQYYEGQRNSFLFALLVLASYIIRADGRVMHSEMEFVRSFLRRNFGEAAVGQGNEILLRLFDEQKRMEAGRPGAFKSVIRESCAQIAANMDYPQRLQLLNFLVMIAQADGSVVSLRTDSTWRARESHYATIGTWSWGNFGGECQDACRALAEWNACGLDDTAWDHAETVASPSPRLVAQPCELNRQQEFEPARSITRLDDGSYEIAFARALTGNYRVYFPPLKAGDTVVLHFADTRWSGEEAVETPAGRVATMGLRYTRDGKPTATPPTTSAASTWLPVPSRAASTSSRNSTRWASSTSWSRG